MTAACRLSFPSDYREEAESLIKLVVSDIIKECQNRGESVSEPLVAFLVTFLTAYHTTSLKRVCRTKRMNLATLNCFLEKIYKG